MSASADTLGAALAGAAARIGRLDARLLLQHVSGCRHTDLIAHPETPLAPEPAAAFVALVARREAGEPLAYLVGSKEFLGLDLAVSPAVLVPRPETELLVELAQARAQALALSQNLEAPAILDLGTGSGAVALGLAHLLPQARITAVDASAEALAIARHNAERLGLTVQFVLSDWYGELPAAERFDLIVSNPPYIEAGDPHLAQGGLPFEPLMALTDGADGLECIRRIIGGAPQRLTPGGWLLFEHGYDQAEKARELLSAAGFKEIGSWRDLAGIERVSGGRRQD